VSDKPRTRISAAAAAAAILEPLSPLDSERTPLADALGSVLAEPVESPIDIPPWDNSAMDGYAVRSADLGPGGEPTVLKIVEEVAAGGFPTREIAAGECTRIFTGAPVPQGADTVIRQEDTTRLEEGRVRIDDSRDAGRNVRSRGEDIARGSLVFGAGDLLGPARIGVLASMAWDRPLVHRRPMVATLATGDEIADLSERDAILSGRKIASSNSYTMRAAVQEAGGDLLELGIAGDDPAVLHGRLERAGAADLLVTSGGMSVGEHDHLRGMLEELGGGMKFWRLRTRPGAPLGFGILDDLPWIGLPGNPVSTMVTFELFVRPAIRRLAGHARPFRRAVPVKVGEPVSTPARLTHFLRVRLQEEDGETVARLTGPQGSGMLTSMAKADALLIVPEGVDQVPAGESLGAIVLNDSAHVEQPPY
jgi:molybdopterin molybdotransferase